MSFPSRFKRQAIMLTLALGAVLAAKVYFHRLARGTAETAASETALSEPEPPQEADKATTSSTFEVEAPVATRRELPPDAESAGSGPVARKP